MERTTSRQFKNNIFKSERSFEFEFENLFASEGSNGRYGNGECDWALVRPWIVGEHGG